MTKRRFASLDWARGWMLVASVSVNSILFMPAWFNHAPWDGVHPLDIIFPMFVTLSGCGLAFALSRGVAFGPLLRRILVLFVVGLAYNAVMDWSLDFSTWRITGVLQLYALIVPAISVLHLMTRTARGWATITGVLALAHSALLLGYARGCADGVLTPQCNPSLVIDPLVFGNDHIYAGGRMGHDPEGIIVIFGALVAAAAGATVGHFIRSVAGRANTTNMTGAMVRGLGVSALYFLMLGLAFITVLPLAFNAELPVMKRLWTAPFSLFIATGVTLLILLGYLLIDRKPLTRFEERAAHPLISLGRNSLLVYFGSHVLTRVLDQPLIGDRSIEDVFVALVPSPIITQLVWTGALLTFWVVLAMVLHRNKIYIKP